MTIVQSIILAAVEGLTEYLPISSTGHIILTSWLMGINEQAFVKDFTVMVQFGAIMSVIVLYWRKFLLNLKLYPRVFVAFLPAVIVGLLVKDQIDAILGSVWIVGISLLAGGLLLILTDRWILKIEEARKASGSTAPTLDTLPLLSAHKIGWFQVLAFVPGVSRSAASIWGGLCEGLNLRLATEFSFFLAVPTLTGASLLKLRKAWPTLGHDEIQMLLIGNLVSFVIGAIAIKSFVELISRYGLKMFGYYRIVVGALVLIVLALGYDVELAHLQSDFSGLRVALASLDDSTMP